MTKTKIRLACVGAGYFARFHIEAWSRIPEVELVAICDLNLEKARTLAQEFNIPKVYLGINQLLDTENIDVLDIITPPETHFELCLLAARKGIHIICQKPLAPTLQEAQKMVNQINKYDVHFIVHENWRFQPWYRKIKELLDSQAVGDRLHSIFFQMRMGDGWGEDAYLDRQPYFRTMPRLLVHETGIHFIDTFRYLGGEIESVFAQLKRLNPVISGEDAGYVLFNFVSGANALLDANRFNESKNKNARYTFGEMLIEGSKGSIRLYYDGQITLQKLGEKEIDIVYKHEDKNFAGDCVFYLQKHIINCFINNIPCENNSEAYLKNLIIQEAIYRSAGEKKLITIDS